MDRISQFEVSPYGDEIEMRITTAYECITFDRLYHLTTENIRVHDVGGIDVLETLCNVNVYEKNNDIHHLIESMKTGDTEMFTEVVNSILTICYPDEIKRQCESITKNGKTIYYDQSRGLIFGEWFTKTVIPAKINEEIEKLH
jgi:hypothetical protein